MSHRNQGRFALYAAVLLVFVPGSAQPCSIVGSISPNEMVRRADVIIRALATEYDTPPADASVVTTGVPDSVVRFRVLEVLKGKLASSEIALNGYLSDVDDFNDQEAPYTFVRAGGRAGSCFANSYKRGAEFLLMLRRNGKAFTVNWYALGPVNEQLRSGDDPWLGWVRKEVKRPH